MMFTIGSNMIKKCSFTIMNKNLKTLFFNEKLYIRFISLFILFFIFFNGVTIISYFLLPEGFLLEKNSILDWDTSGSTILSTIQIFLFNIISVIFIVISNYFAFPSKDKAFMPLGYWRLIILFTLNGITLGTWSFTAINTTSPDLLSRLVKTFDILHKAGLWEITGQLLIAGATARIAIIKKDGKDIYIRFLKESSLNKTEILCIIIGLCLMLAGAFIESNAIILHK